MRIVGLTPVVCVALATFCSAQIPDNETCEFIRHGTPIVQLETVPTDAEYASAVAELDIDAVLKDIIALLTESDECWPADSFPESTIGQSYGGLFIRLAWHCSGSYRNTDQRGGCAGGEMRFQPEAAWEDNTNLDKARALVYPIKEKYGDALSWGDLIVLAGTASMLHMGAPVTEVCVGRIDNEDGSNSESLGGPGTATSSCPEAGNCTEPFGASTVELIYVNPEGFKGEPNRETSASQIRKIFARMDMNDTETVALIGGGHAFGKSHGACPSGHGPSPDEHVSGEEYNPWPGACGTGRGTDAFTSGIEGYWTHDPFKWDNEYFQLLRDNGDAYTVGKGPGDKYQWSIESEPALMMMTTDVALWTDSAYREIVTEFANNIDSLNVAFANAWAKLTSRGGRFSDAKKCITPQWPLDTTYLAEALQESDGGDGGNSASSLTASAVFAVAVSLLSSIALP